MNDQVIIIENELFNDWSVVECKKMMHATAMRDLLYLWNTFILVELMKIINTNTIIKIQYAISQSSIKRLNRPSPPDKLHCYYTHIQTQCTVTQRK